MCGRFTLFDSAGFLSKALGIPDAIDLTPRYNIAPSQQILAVRTAPESGRREFAWLHWGFIPRGAKEPASGYRMINARAETAAEKPAFREAFRRRRCLVPASGFYEWRKAGEKKGERKQPYYVRMKDRRPFGIAGLWERWPGTDDLPVEGCALITTDANETISALHDRMPAILSPDAYELWLDPGIADRERLQRILRPFPADEMEAFEVGLQVNDPKSDDSRCIRAS